MKRCAALAFLVALLVSSAALAAPLTKAADDTPEAHRATRALNILEAQGYAAGLQDNSFTAFRDFHAQGKDYIATVRQNGRMFQVIVDPETGQITRQD